MKRFSEEEKAMWLQDWQQSGKSSWTYARENGLCPQTFTKWTKPREKEVNHSHFVEIPREIYQPNCRMQEILIEKGNMRIHIPLEPVLNELHTVIARLGQAL